MLRHAEFFHKDYFWCPRHKGTEQAYECTRAITGRQVINVIERLRQDLQLTAPNGVVIITNSKDNT